MPAQPAQPVAGVVGAPAGAWPTSLLEAIRIIIHADSDPVRQTLFSRLRDEDRIVALVSGVHDWLGRGRAASALVSLFGLKTYLTIDDPLPGRHTILSIAVFANARREVQEVQELLGNDAVTTIAVGKRTLFRIRTLRRLVGLVLRPRRWVRFVRLVHATNQNNFLVACRVASVIAAYARCAEILARTEARGVLVASDSNPEEVALKLAARRMGVPSIFASHAYTTPVSPPLRFDLAILEGTAALRSFEAKGPVRAEVVYRGLDGASSPLDVSRFEKTAPTIGIFAPKAPGWDALTRAITDCLQRFPGCKILIRWHPSMLGEVRLGALRGRPDVIETPQSAKVGEIVGQCDWGIADESSNVVLDLLKRGVAALCVRDLTILPPERADLYGFLANGILFPRIESIAALDVPRALQFYSGDWAQRFSAYDAGYLRDAADVKQEIRGAIQRVIARGESGAAR